MEFESIKDVRGTIAKVYEGADVLVITSKKGARRANHYHKTSGHWCYVSRGSITYLERPVGSSEKPIRKVIGEHEWFWTGPNVEHLMLFEEFDDNEFICVSTGKRNQTEYENDLVRLPYQLDECL